MARQPKFTQLHWDWSGKPEDAKAAANKMNLIFQDIVEMFWEEARVTDKILAALTASGSALDHGGLSGLADDDHTQYIRVDGTRAFSGSQSMGSNKLTSLAAATVSGDAIRYEQGFKFETISTTSGTAPVADALNDTLTLTAGSNITITGNSATDTITFAVPTSPSHNILSTVHSDTSGAGSEADGDLIHRRTGTWQRLAVGGSGSFVRSNGTSPTWSVIQVSDLPAHNVLSNTYHGDAETASIARGDLLRGDSTPRINRIAIGATKTWLKSDGTDPSWAATPICGYSLFRSVADSITLGTNPATTTSTMTNLGTTFVILGAVCVVSLDDFANIRILWRGMNSGVQAGTISVELLMDGATSLVTATTTSTSLATRTATAAISQTGDHYIYTRVKSSVAADDPQFNFIGFELY